MVLQKNLMLICLNYLLQAKKRPSARHVMKLYLQHQNLAYHKSYTIKLKIHW